MRRMFKNLYLFVLTGVLALFAWDANALSTSTLYTGYPCPKIRQFTDCVENYYLTGTDAGNDCEACPAGTGWKSTSNVGALDGWGKDTSCTCPKGYYNADDDTDQVVKGETCSLKPYNITYELDGGTNYADAPATYTINDFVTFGTPTKEYHDFVAWYTEAEFTNTITRIDRGSTGDITVWAKWTPKQYTVTFDKQDGVGGTESTTVTYGEDMPTITLPTKENNVFNGYFDAISSGKQYYTDTGASAATWDKGDATLYAQWTECQACATTNATCELSVVANKCTYVTQCEPGYTNIQNDGAYNASCSADTFEITLEKQGGTGGSDSVSVTYGQAMPSITLPTKTNNVFNGYFDATSAGKQYYTDTGASASNWDKTEATSLYAQWTECQACDATNATCELSVVENQCVYETECLPGFTNIQNNGQYNASCSADSFEVTLDKQGGTGGDSSVSVTYGQAMPAITAPTKRDNIFKGYFDAISSGKQYYTDTGASATTWDKASGDTLYARWEKCQPCNPTNATCYLSVVGNECKYTTSCEVGYDNIVGNGTATPSCSPISYSVTYSCGEGTGPAPSSDTATYNQRYTPKANTCTKENSLFQGWKVSGTENIKQAGVGFTWEYQESKTFTAQWSSCQPCEPTNATCSVSSVDNECVYETACLPGYDNIQNNGQYNPICTGKMHKIEYICNAFTGDSTVLQTYTLEYQPEYTVLSVDTSTCRAPGQKFVDYWQVSQRVESGATESRVHHGGYKITWHPDNDLRFIAMPEDCKEAITEPGTCGCESNQYPNGSGSCSNCSVSCSGEITFNLGEYNVCLSQTDDICYRQCTTDDIANSTGVSGTVTKGGVNTCEASSCEADYYLENKACVECPENATCDGGSNPFECQPGYHKTDDGKGCEPDEYDITLNKNGGTGTINGSTGTMDATQKCKHGESCSLPSSGLERTGWAFTGWGNSSSCTSGVYQMTFTSAKTVYACWSQQTTDCEVGQQYNGSTHETCESGYFCTGEGVANIGTPGCSTKCPGDADGSTPGSSTDKGCYKNCPGKTITGGTITTIEDQVFYDGMKYPTCTYRVSCDKGYVAENQNSANANCRLCEPGDYCPGGEGTDPLKCPEGGTSDAGATSDRQCYKTCPPKSITGGTATNVEDQVFYDGASYPTCTYRVSCDKGYVAENQNSANANCRLCEPGDYCPGGEGTDPLKCPDGGTSDAGATSDRQCYKTCGSSSITGGSLTAVSEKVYYDGLAYPVCTYVANCDKGYVAENQNSATATCRLCEPGDYCPGGEGTDPLKCPDGGTSAAGATSDKECYKTCPEPSVIENGTLTNVQDQVYYNGSTYPACTYKATCDEGYVAQNSPGTNPTCVWSDPDECPVGYYCEDGKKIPCPDGGTTDGGATSITQCYKDFDPYDEFDYGVASARCHWLIEATDYKNCKIKEVKSCIAGYWYKEQGAFACSGTESGFYSPEGDIDQTACPVDPAGGKVESTALADSFTDCYKTCTLEVPHSTYVAAKENEVYGISEVAYAACSFNVTCETGYTVQDNNTEAPSCKANEYTITLNKNGGVGDVVDSIKCVFDSQNCQLPDVSGLTRTGYTVNSQWCSDKSNGEPCYEAGTVITENISADGTDTELFASWEPNIYTVNLDGNSATTEGDPTVVYLKYATGWYSDSSAMSNISNMTTLPTKTGYQFLGYSNESDVMAVDSTGNFLANEQALTVATESPTTLKAKWSAGSTSCDAGTYYSGTGTECKPCESNYYCPGGSFETDSGSIAGRFECPDSGSSEAGASDIGQCYKNGLPYSAVNGAGTQRCFYNKGETKYNSACDTKVINACNAGYYLAQPVDEDCTVVGNGYYSAATETERHACPAGGTTDIETAVQVQECFKTGLVYNAVYGSGTQRCFYTSGDGAEAIYQRDCDTKVITACRGGYYLAEPSNTDCSPVGKNYYSPTDDIERHICPADGETKSETTDNIKFCYKPGQPYTGQHGKGLRVCYYTSGEGASAIYSSSCETPTMTFCDGGYYYNVSTRPDDCIEVGIGYYSPEGPTERTACPQSGTTETKTSDSVSACYLAGMSCVVPNGQGEQTCYYDENGSSYSASCTTCTVTSCDEGYSQVGNECVDCPEDYVCSDGQKNSCAELTGNTHPHSDAGTTDKNMCYTDCPLAENAMSMTGRDYYGIPDTCQVERCLPGFYPDKGACVVCPEGWICDGTDPEKKSCADLGDGSWKYSEPGAKEDSDCYRICESYPLIGGTAIPINEKEYWPDECKFRGETDDGEPCEIVGDECVITSCKYNQEMVNGHCEPCNREHALDYVPGFNCVVASCEMGWHPKGQRCEEDIRECRIPNAVYAEQKWDSSINAFGQCIVKECEPDFHIVANACVRDSRACAIENGVGVQYWNDRTNSWGDCEVVSCNPGYTDDSFDSAEPTKQCGRCKNMYSVLGEVAVSGYVQECEIASCLYQGELYNLDNNECVPICDLNGYEDETGTMKWDPNRKKCVRTCKEGYSMW